MSEPTTNAAAAADPEPTTTTNATDEALDAAPVASDPTPEVHDHAVSLDEEVSAEELPEQTDNTERPEDGEQDVSQTPGDAA